MTPLAKKAFSSRSTLFIISFVLTLGIPIAAWAVPQTQETRLIETGPNARQWMTQGQIRQLSQEIHRTGKCGGFMDVTDHADEPSLSAQTVDSMLFWSEPKSPTKQALVRKLLGKLSAHRINDTVAKLAAFPNRNNESQQGAKAAQWIRDQFVTAAMGRKDVTADLFRHNGYPQPSVIVRLQGRDPGKAADTIVIGGHEDSINWNEGFGDPDHAAPGADDNASGVATVLEVFRVLMEENYQPERTLEFMTYAGEERGLLGSQDIAKDYKKKSRSVVAAMQFDMTMHPGNDRQINLISDYTNKELTDFVKVLIDTYVKAPWVSETCGYACSDHASWHKQGYPSVFPFEGPDSSMNRRIHSEDDLLKYLDAEWGLHYAKIGVAFAVELGSGE